MPPDIPLTENDGTVTGWLTIQGEYQPFAPEPIGYCDRFEWARVQQRAGLRQHRCSKCRRYCYPQKIAYFLSASEDHPNEFVCLKCSEEN